jgi:hypothetical protein
MGHGKVVMSAPVVVLALCAALVVVLPLVVIACVAARARPDRPIAPPLPPMAPQWARDPSGRHELRYWDGRRWTPNVSDRGVVSVDP